MMNHWEPYGNIHGLKKEKEMKGGENSPNFIKMDLKASFYNMYTIGNAKFVYCTNVV
jgi:hypothetical protein